MLFEQVERGDVHAHQARFWVIRAGVEISFAPDDCGAILSGELGRELFNRVRMCVRDNASRYGLCNFSVATAVDMIDDFVYVDRQSKP